MVVELLVLLSDEGSTAHFSIKQHESCMLYVYQGTASDDYATRDTHAFNFATMPVLGSTHGGTRNQAIGTDIGNKESGDECMDWALSRELSKIFVGCSGGWKECGVLLGSSPRIEFDSSNYHCYDTVPSLL